MNTAILKVSLSAFIVSAATFTIGAAVVRKLPAINVVENETVSIDAIKAKAVRSSNDAVFSASLRETGEAVINGLRLGSAEFSYIDERGVFATRPVMVVPAYWDVLRKMFSEDPEITVDIIGDKVVVGGSTANVETLKRVEQSKSMDAARIVTQVTYSTAQIGELMRGFLARANYTNITVSVVGREVCLSGRLYDAQSIAQLTKRVEGFVKEFPGVTVNADELKITKQKIMIGIEFVAYNSKMMEELGIRWPGQITGEGTLEFGYDRTKTIGKTHRTDNESKFDAKSAQKSEWSRNTSDTASGTTSSAGNNSESTYASTLSKVFGKNTARDSSWNANAAAKISGLRASINMLETSGVGKKMYSTTLSTQSGIEAEFQNGGTVYMQTSDLYKTDMKQIEYGYIIKATPLIIDENTVNLDFDLDLKQDMGRRNDGMDYTVTRYQTKSKYLVRPGESIVLSGYKYTDERDDKDGLPWLAKIPLIGKYLFGSDARAMEMDEMMLVVTVDWAVDNDAASVKEKLTEIKDRKVEAELNR